MRKLIFFFITTFVVTSVSAQGLDLGIKAGANFANITDASGLSNKTGFVFGAFAGAKLNDKLGIQGDLLYSQQGAEFNGGEIDLTYVNIPVVLKYFVTENLNLQAGPQFGFVVDDNVKEVFNSLAEAESFDLTGVIGAGYEFPFGIRVSGRYHFGLTDVTKSNAVTDTETAGTRVVEASSGKNTVITLAIGYSFL